MEGSYTYTSLPAGDVIRLITLHPGQQGDPIEFDLLTLELNSRTPQYEAISYVWGSETNRKDAKCDGVHTVTITSSLYGALGAARNSTHPKFVWADAICINQKDILERAQQVNLMGTIFGNAEHVLAWIDVKFPDGIHKLWIHHVNSILDHVEQKISSNSLRPTSWEEFATLIIRNGEDFQKDHDFQDGSYFAGYILSSLFFSRVWIIQEIGLARSITAHIGKWSIEMSKLVAYSVCMVYGLAGVHDNFYKHTRRIVDTLMYVWCYFAKAVDTARGGRTWMHELQCLSAFTEYYPGHAEFGLESVLNGVRNFQASDERDHVFAFLGHPLATIGNENLDANYTLDMDAVNIACADWLCKNGSIKQLSYVQHEDGRELESSLPSWVPRWEQHNERPLFANIFGLLPSHNDRKKTFERLPSGALKVTAMVFDKIKQVGKPTKTQVGSHRFHFPSESLSFETENELEDILGIWLLIAKTHGATKPTLMKFISFVYMANFVALNRAQTLFDFYHYLEHVLSELDMSGDLGLCAAFRRHIKPDIDTGSKEWETGNHRRYFIMINAAFEKTRFLMAQSEFGFGPPLAQVNDLICFILETNDFFVIRPAENGLSYKLIGPCYMCGLMEGGLQEMIEKKNIKELAIILT
jgi:hypothetical protein